MKTLDLINAFYDGYGWRYQNLGSIADCPFKEEKLVNLWMKGYRKAEKDKELENADCKRKW